MPYQSLGHSTLENFHFFPKDRSQSDILAFQVYKLYIFYFYISGNYRKLNYTINMNLLAMFEGRAVLFII